MRYLYLFLTLVLVSCGTDSHHFKIDGRLLNLNQGEFYVYSTDGIIDGIDTIRVEAGRFSYEIKCEKKGTLVIVFPNFSEQPVFTQPGKNVTLEGDVSKLRELKVKGTDENKLMNQFREQSINASPKEIQHYIKLITEDHPTSIVPIYLVGKFFMQAEMPDYKTASTLYDQLLKAQPDNGRLKLLAKQVKAIAKCSEGSNIPKFKATDINGKTITDADIKKGDALIYLWSSWEYESCNIQRNLRDRNRMTDMHVIGICIDGSKKECERVVERDKITHTIICDEKMLNGNLVQLFAFNYFPDNILIKNGKIVERSLSSQDLRKKLQ